MTKANQTTAHLLMIRPANFGFNNETAINNAFQRNDSLIAKDEISKLAKKEFDGLVKQLRKKGINVLVLKDTKHPIKTDAVFSNNWISMHGDGTLITYPMFSANRRLERDAAIIDALQKDYKITELLDFSNFENINHFLEGTGSMVLDRPNRIAYACKSPRTSEVVLDRYCLKMGYKKILFGAEDKKGQAIYHTNVMMSMGDCFVVICLDCIRDKDERSKLLKQFKKSKKEVIELTFSQMNNFAGNMLQVRNKKGKSFLLMSSSAFNSLTKKEIKIIEKYTKILHASIPIIEKYGGGSIRCMIAENFLPIL